MPVFMGDGEGAFVVRLFSEVSRELLVAQADSGDRRADVTGASVPSAHG